MLSVLKSTPDAVWLGWTSSADIHSYRLIVNGVTKAVLPATSDRFVVDDGVPGQHYAFKLEKMIGENGKAVSSASLLIRWPGVTLPRCQLTVNGQDEAIVSWGDSVSINHGEIESYTLYLYDVRHSLLTAMGPYPAQQRQVWIKDLKAESYAIVLEIQLAHSYRCLRSKPMKIPRRQLIVTPRLTYHRTATQYEEQLIEMTYRMIHMINQIESKVLTDRYQALLANVLAVLKTLTNSVRLNLSIEVNSTSQLAKYRLLIDGKETPLCIPGFEKSFPIELPRRNRPYALTVSDDINKTVSNTIFVECSKPFTLFCAHFDTLLRDNLHPQMMCPDALLRNPSRMISIQVFDWRQNQMVYLPCRKSNYRFSLILFYSHGCVPSLTHLNYLSTYAASHPMQYHYICINCCDSNIDELKSLCVQLEHIQCYTGFSAEEFRYKQNTNGEPLWELLSLDGVPMYYILDYSGCVVWKGHLCTRDQTEYNAALDHVTAEVHQLPCPSDDCKLCFYRSWNETSIELNLNELHKRFRSMVEEAFFQPDDQSVDRTRSVTSMKEWITDAVDRNDY